MNLSEIFFFKVFECVKESNNKLNKSSHNEKNCYFYHNSEDYFEKDKRRELISFSSFFKQLRTNLEEGDIILTLDTIFEFKNIENNFSLNYYTNKPSFSNYNNCIYNQFDYCKNEVEFFYHIKNYKKSKCKHQEINKTCKKKFCNKYHNKNELDENEKNGINYFIKIIDSWIDKNEIKLIEIIEVFNTIISTKNRFLSGLQLNEIKQDFEPFLKFYNEYQKTKNNNLMNFNNYQMRDNNKAQRIMQEIDRDLNQNNEKNRIHKNSNLFKVLNISNKICLLPSSEVLKSGELIKYIYAFLNSSDGVIIYGSKFKDNNYIVEGISIKQKERDKFKKWFNSEFLKIYVEFEENLKFKFYDLANNNKEECLLVIDIKQIKITKFLMPSSKIFFIIKEDILNSNKEGKNKIIDEKDITELDTKQYIEFISKRFNKYYSNKFGIKQQISNI